MTYSIRSIHSIILRWTTDSPTCFSNNHWRGSYERYKSMIRLWGVDNPKVVVIWCGGKINDEGVLLLSIPHSRFKETEAPLKDKKHSWEDPTCWWENKGRLQTETSWTLLCNVDTVCCLVTVSSCKNIYLYIFLLTKT